MQNKRKQWDEVLNFTPSTNYETIVSDLLLGLFIDCVIKYSNG